MADWIPWWLVVLSTNETDSLSGTGYLSVRQGFIPEKKTKHPETTKPMRTRSTQLPERINTPLAQAHTHTGAYVQESATIEWIVRYSPGSISPAG